MDQQQLHVMEANCTQENLPRCTAACPIHVDARGMMAAVRKGDFSAGYDLFAKMAPFPGIISRVCDHPCQEACKRGEVGDGIAINALERACRDFNTKSLIKNNWIPNKDKKAAVVGAGISGLTVALDLAKKGYKLTVFDAGNEFGGRLLKIPEAKLPRQIIADDFEILTSLGVQAKFGVTVGNSDGADVLFDDLLTEFDAVYLGLGQIKAADLVLGLEMDSDGCIRIDPVTLGTSNPKVFAGGSYRQDNGNLSLINSVSDGRSAAVSIDRVLQGVSLTASRSNEGPLPTRLFTSTEGVEPQPVVAMADPGQGYTGEEATAEAERCLDCQCMECVKLCEYMKHYRAFPRSYARQIYKNMSSAAGHKSNQMINSCSMCRLCEEVCQDNFSMADICRKARETMVSTGKMPPSAFGFALQDLEYSNSDAFALARHEPGFSKSEVMFYPGCQLSGSAPGQVIKVYNYLRAKIKDGVGLMLGCCGAPADWAGQKEIFIKTIQSIKSEWERMGKPKVILGCPTCFMIFKNNLPDISVEFLWTFIDQIGLPEVPATESYTLAVHDSCTTRYEREVHDSVRNILRQLGHKVEELKTSRELTECCGFGGLMQISNKDLAHMVVDRRTGESDKDYVAYCAMCRDNFTNRGKKTYHLLDLIFGDKTGKIAARPPVGYSQRHENRARLKNTLLREIWGEAVQDKPALVKLVISDELSSLMEDSLILVSDLQQVVEYAERTGNRLQNSTNGHFLAYYKPAYVTYWAEYSAGENSFVIHDAYSHRMEITDK
ncbi:pyridine nucleotide-disulfide oxidoreductase/dicluster-binding protein [Sporomusa sp. KB1]|jgi:NADPH-dependent glutamate synthase beta subunit-like oxidoreductase/peptidyl-tRNA hydrolase|uniref:pyridine nucleotide-disulfide oxidoreductase/dicluster-binding protein n=1 Tax=Sporomusa sp. KB1 TaxID=943346 RepID=UPI0011A3E01E|nr:pyridine nucleotide-disulfide oxidoreductase/dicluster-binding protein [Sporomusa sp. KB1]TWH48730.1 NADPH-dependent glutamate synthase beta chain and related oxidoreductases [Sporomusa sp. KB1]